MSKETKKTKAFWVFIVLGILIVLMAVILSPIWKDMGLFFSSWGGAFVFALMGVGIVLYLVFLHGPRLKDKNEHNGGVKAINIIEIVVLSMVALLSVTCQIVTLGATGPCHILGIVFWICGVLHTLRALLKKGSANTGYLIFTIILAVLSITFGTFIFLRPLFSTTDLQWVLAFILVVMGVYFFVHGIKVKPVSEKKEKTKDKK